MTSVRRSAVTENSNLFLKQQNIKIIAFDIRVKYSDGIPLRVNRHKNSD